MKQKIFIVFVLLGLLICFLPKSHASAQMMEPGELSRFALEMNQDPFLRSLVELKRLVNGLKPNSGLLLGTHLKQTTWYDSQSARLSDDPYRLSLLDGALRHLDQHSSLVPGQKLQCIGFAILLNGLADYFPAIGGEEITIAKDLIPDSIKNGDDLYVGLDSYQALVITEISEIQLGDFIMRYDSAVGHVSAIVAIKEIKGQIVLLMATANQYKNGQITFLEVDQENFDTIFGPPTFKKVILRKY